MKKEHGPTAIATVKLSKSELRLDDARIMAFIEEHGRKVLYIIVALIVLILVIFRMTASTKVNAETDYLNADVEYARLQSAVSEDDSSAFAAAVDKLEQIFSRRPELHAKYDGPIAQAFLEEGNAVQAQKFGEETLKRTRGDNLPLYADYAKTSLIMASAGYAQALDAATALKENMLKDAVYAQNAGQEKTFSDLLFAFNLLRIAMLQQQLGDTGGELRAWNELKQYAGLKKDLNPSPYIDPRAVSTLLTQFKMGKVSLLSYADEREKQLMRS